MDESKDRSRRWPVYTIGRQAERSSRLACRVTSFLRKQEPDFFLDYIVEIVEKGEPSGRQFAVQVKGVEVGENTAMPRRYRAQGKHVRYWCGNVRSRVSVPDSTSKQGRPMLFVKGSFATK